MSLDAKGPCASSAVQALQIAPSSVARAVWCGSGVVMDGMTECSRAEVADSLVCFAVCGYGRRAVTAMSTPACCLAAKGPCVFNVLQALQIATSSVARAVWCASGAIADGKTEWHGAEVAHGLVCFAAIGC